MSAPKVDVLPCPFCGATDIIVSYYEFRGDGADQYPQDVVCPNCPAGFCGHEFKGQGTTAVIAAWNRRVHSATVAELIDDADRMAKWIVNRGQELRDHGCRECVGTGDLVVEGFRCGYHTALARIGGAA